MCIRDRCTTVVHNTARNSSDNFPSYPSDNHHCSGDVYWMGGDHIQWKCISELWRLSFRTLWIHKRCAQKLSGAVRYVIYSAKTKHTTKALARGNTGQFSNISSCNLELWPITVAYELGQVERSSQMSKSEVMSFESYRTNTGAAVRSHNPDH